jgi:hypothetical protein
VAARALAAPVLELAVPLRPQEHLWAAATPEHSQTAAVGSVVQAPGELPRASAAAAGLLVQALPPREAGADRPEAAPEPQEPAARGWADKVAAPVAQATNPAP